MRAKRGFTGRIYMRVSTFVSSSYDLTVAINYKKFVVLENQVMQMIKMEGGAIENLIYEDATLKAETPEDGIIGYKLKVEMRAGILEIGVRDCDLLSRGVEGCLIHNITELQDQ
jgi:hypothetical protein